jgi:hypothetical protein
MKTYNTMAVPATEATVAPTETHCITATIQIPGIKIVDSKTYDSIVVEIADSVGAPPLISAHGLDARTSKLSAADRDALYDKIATYAAVEIIKASIVIQLKP